MALAVSVTVLVNRGSTPTRIGCTPGLVTLTWKVLVLPRLMTCLVESGSPPVLTGTCRKLTRPVNGWLMSVPLTGFCTTTVMRHSPGTGCAVNDCMRLVRLSVSPASLEMRLLATSDSSPFGSVSTRSMTLPGLWANTVDTYRLFLCAGTRNS